MTPDDFPSFVTGSFNTLLKHVMDNAALPGSIPPTLQAGPSRPPTEALPKQQVIRAAESYHSFPSVNAAKDRAAVITSDFQPFTHGEVPISKGSNYEDPEIIHGLLESVILDSHREYFCSRPDDPASLLSSGVKSIFMGLSDIVHVKSKNDDSMAHAKDQVQVLKKQLAAAEEKVKEKEALAENLKSALELAAHTASDELERKFVAYRGANERTVIGLRKELKEASRQISPHNAHLSSLIATNFFMRNDLKASREYNSRLEKRHSALMLLLAHIRFRFEEVANEFVGIRFTNKALHKKLVTLEGIRARNALLLEEVDNLRLCATKYSQTFTKLISESGRAAPIPPDAPPTDPRRILLVAWHAEEARLRSTIADLEVRGPTKLLQHFKDIEDDCTNNTLRLSSDGYADGYSDGYNHGRSRALANSTITKNLGTEIDSQIDGIIQMLTENDQAKIAKNLETLRLAREISDMGTEFLFFKNR